ncbi:MAG: peptidyl-prolyl cis-trans isomerase [Candidatus Aminicenantes bacterium]|nr:peptidyl-prolyl cis-trans isomerase [Candidatus Aminicenantes bacterium]
MILVISFACHKIKKEAKIDNKEGLGKDRIILILEGKNYSENDFFQYVEKQLGKKATDLTSPVLSRLVDQFIEERLWLEAARQEGILISEEEKEAYRKSQLDLTQNNPLSPEAESYFIERLMIEKYIQALTTGIEISDEEIRIYYNQNKREFLLPERVRVSQIIVSNEAEAIHLQNQLKTGDEALFRKLAQKISIGPEASRGGELGIFKANELPKEIEKVIFSLREGEISPVVESPYGFHIFRLDSRLEPRLLSLEEAADKIRAKLLREKIDRLMKKHLEDLKAKFNWQFFPDRLSFHYEKENS